MVEYGHLLCCRDCFVGYVGYALFHSIFGGTNVLFVAHTHSMTLL